MQVNRRDVLHLGGLSLLAAAARKSAAAEAPDPEYTIKIANGLAEPGPEQIVSTDLYNGQFPGPLLRFRQGQPGRLRPGDFPGVE